MDIPLNAVEWVWISISGVLGVIGLGLGISMLFPKMWGRDLSAPLVAIAVVVVAIAAIHGAIWFGERPNYVDEQGWRRTEQTIAHDLLSQYPVAVTSVNTQTKAIKVVDLHTGHPCSGEVYSFFDGTYQWHLVEDSLLCQQRVHLSSDGLLPPGEP